MIQYSRKFGIHFAPDAGGASGAAAPQAASPPAPESPFAKIDKDSLDDESRAALEKAETEFASLQKSAAEAQKVASERQSAHDKLVAEHNKLQKQFQPQQAPKQETTADRIQRDLIAGGIPEEVASKQAVVLAKVLDSERAQIKKEVGVDLAPVINLTLHREATEAFNYARAVDRTGWSTNYEVCQAVWQTAEAMVQEGRQVTGDVIKNLAGMHWLNFAEQNGGNFAPLQPNGGTGPQQGVPGRGAPAYGAPNVPNMTTGGFPGSYMSNISIPRAPDSNAPKHVLDPATSAALAAVSSVWNKELGKKPTGGLV